MLTPSAETQKALPLQSQKVRRRRGQWVSRDHAWGRAILPTATTCGNIVPSRKVVKVRSIFLDTTPVDIRSLIRAIYFKEARTPLSVTDLLHYNATLGLLLDGCNNLEDIVIKAPRNSGEPTARLMAPLPMIPGLALRQITLKRGVYQQLPLERLFQRVAHNLRTLLLSQVRFLGRIRRIWSRSGGTVLFCAWLGYNAFR